MTDMLHRGVVLFLPASANFVVGHVEEAAGHAGRQADGAVLLEAHLVLQERLGRREGRHQGRPGGEGAVVISAPAMDDDISTLYDEVS